MAHRVYRKTTLGFALVEAIERMNADPAMQLPGGWSKKVLEHFDNAITHALTSEIAFDTKFTGDRCSYRYCENTWQFILHNFSFSTDDNVGIAVDRARIVAIDCKLRAGTAKSGGGSGSAAAAAAPRGAGRGRRGSGRPAKRRKHE